MITHRDTFSGPSAEILSNHTPELGGPWLLQGATAGTFAKLTGLGSVNADPAGSQTYYLSTRLPLSAYNITFTGEIDALNITTTFGLVLSSNTAFGQYLQVSITPGSNTIVVDNNGATHTVAFTWTAGTPTTFNANVEDDNTVGRVFKLYQDGFLLLTLNNTAVPDTPLLMLFWDAAAGPGTIAQISNLTAQTNTVNPTKATAFLSPTLGVFVQYTPKTGSALSALRFEYAARAIILKGPLADQAVQYLIDTTPPELVFAP